METNYMYITILEMVISKIRRHKYTSHFGEDDFSASKGTD